MSANKSVNIRLNDTFLFEDSFMSILCTEHDSEQTMAGKVTGITIKRYFMLILLSDAEWQVVHLQLKVNDIK